MFPEGFKGRAKRLDDLDLPKIGRLIGVGEDEIHAILEVESRGSGFDAAGRPVILFEPHIFWRMLGAGAKRDDAARKGLAYPKWGSKPYPKDSYPRLREALKIDEAAALKSCSWGLGQILGSNFKAAGYSSVQEMVAAFCDDEEEHLAAMVRFIISVGLADAVRRHDWARFARGYNGPGYAANRYDTRLATAFAKWKKIPDTPFDLSHAVNETLEHDASPDVIFERETTRQAPPPARSPVENVEEELAEYEVKAVQGRLMDLGYFEVGMIDGHFGTKTTAAIAAFQKDNGIDVTGKLTLETKAALATAPQRPVSEARKAGTPEAPVVQKGSFLRRIGAMLGFGGASVSFSDVIGQAETAKGYVDRLKELFDPIKHLVADWWPVLLVLVGVWLFLEGGGIVKDYVDRFRRGEISR